MSLNVIEEDYIALNTDSIIAVTYKTWRIKSYLTFFWI